MPIPIAFSRRPEPMRAGCYETLLCRIIDGTYPPGTTLDDDVLAREFGISRAPLREALNRLAAFHMVRVVPRHSTVVTAIDQRSLREGTDVLYALVEAAMCRTLASLTDDDRAVLRAYRDSLTDDDAVRDSVRSCRVWTSYYAVFAARLGNPEFDRTIQWLGPYVRRFNWQIADLIDPRAEADLERAEIEAALAGDLHALLAAWRAHTQVYIPRVIAGVADHGGPVVPDVTGDTCTGRTTRTIQDAITDGTLLPGETLVEGDLVEWLGVSRTPVREALRRLSDRGLVVLEPGRPARVAELRADGVDDLRLAVFTLRLMVARKAMADDPDGFARLLRSRLDVAQHAEPGTTTAALAVQRVCSAINEAFGSGVFFQVLDPLHARSQWYGVRDPDVNPGITLETAAALVAAAEVRDEAGFEAALATYCSVVPVRELAAA